jgi:hypothetical protein
MGPMGMRRSKWDWWALSSAEPLVLDGPLDGLLGSVRSELALRNSGQPASGRCPLTAAKDQLMKGTGLTSHSL